MKQLTQKMKSGELTLLEVPKPIVQASFIVVQNHYSVISAGTERSKLDLGKKSLLQKAKARPDLAKQVWQKVKTEGWWQTYKTVKTRLDEDSALGYSCAGVVKAVGSEVTGIQPGDRVACGGASYANHAEFVSTPKNLVAKVPDSVSLDEAAFTTIGSIALQGVRLAQPLLGERILVIGLGLIGQVTCQLLRANGCQVVGFDPDQQKAKFAERYQAHTASDLESLESLCHQTTQGIGVDGVLICAGTSSNQPVELAAELCRSKGRVVIVGAVGMQVPREPYFKKEISLIVSRSYGPGRYDPHYEEGGIDYPIDYVRFTEQRNMACFLQLLAERKIELRELITHRFIFTEAVKAYELIESKEKVEYLGILLEYAEQLEQLSEQLQPAMKAHLKPVEDKVNLSVIGAGNYVAAKLLPILASHKAVHLQTIMSASGRSASGLAKKFGFAASLGEVEQMLSSHSDAVLIATRHNTHAELVCQALKAGKHVFVEKPLALSREELTQVQQALEQASEQQLLVGFNRRFAPLTQQVNEFFQSVQMPKVINIRVNAGNIPAEHWTQDAKIGGGRIIGEACHFVDLASALAQSLPISVFAQGLDNGKSALLNDDVIINVRFANGSIAAIIYTASGSKQLPKEAVEVFAGGKSAVIDDFKTAWLYSATKKRRIKLKAQDKGQKGMLNAWLGALTSAQPCVEPTTLLTNSLATIAVVESLGSGQAINIAE